MPSAEEFLFDSLRTWDGFEFRNQFLTLLSHLRPMSFEVPPSLAFLPSILLLSIHVRNFSKRFYSLSVTSYSTSTPLLRAQFSRL